MPSHAAETELRTTNLVLAEVARLPGISRSEVAQKLGLNLATVSRASRDLIESGLLEEGDTFARPDQNRPGRRFVGLRMRGDGGYIIGIGINAFRQSVTLANLANEKLEEWISPTPPAADGAAFLTQCVDQAAKMLVKQHVPPSRLFGVGLAIAANVDKENGILQSAPTLGWSEPVDVQAIVAQKLGIALAIETPSLAITQAEAAYGLARQAKSVVTLHCSLGFGIGIRKSEEMGGQFVDFGRVLTRAKSATCAPVLLDGLCGGIAVINRTEGEDVVAPLSDAARAELLAKVVTKAVHDERIAEIFFECGQLTGKSFSLPLDILSPDLLLLAGPLAQCRDYVAGVKAGLVDSFGQDQQVPDVLTTPMTPTGASRWLSLRANVLEGVLDLTDLKQEMAA